LLTDSRENGYTRTHGHTHTHTQHQFEIGPTQPHSRCTGGRLGRWRPLRAVAPVPPGSGMPPLALPLLRAWRRSQGQDLAQVPYHQEDPFGRGPLTRSLWPPTTAQTLCQQYQPLPPGLRRMRWRYPRQPCSPMPWPTLTMRAMRGSSRL
jgi:hypothetical protein